MVECTCFIDGEVRTGAYSFGVAPREGETVHLPDGEGGARQYTVTSVAHRAEGAAPSGAGTSVELHLTSITLGHGGS